MIVCEPVLTANPALMVAPVVTVVPFVTAVPALTVLASDKVADYHVAVAVGISSLIYPPLYKVLSYEVSSPIQQ